MIRALHSKYNLIALLLAIAPAAGAQVLTNNGASITITTGGSLTVKGDVSNAAAATITNGGTVNITGNTVNNGAFNTSAASTLSLQGSSAQTLSGATAVNAKDVVVNNAAGITLSTLLNVDGAMTFTNGIITATNSSYPVVFSTTGSVANTPTDASHINGYVQKKGTGAFLYPTGDAAKYQPVGTNLSANGSGMTARYYGTDAGSAPYGTGGSSSTPLLFYNKKEYWDLTPATTATGTITIYFDSYNNVGIGNTADLRVAHKSGGQYLNEGGTATGTTASGSVTSNSISTFSPFTLGSISASSPLPLRLVSFAGQAENAANRLDWQTAVEDAGATFTIERAGSAGGYDQLGNVSGKGSNSQYTFYDGAPLTGISYYRLSLTETGGAMSYSHILALRRGNGSVSQVAVYPVPASQSITISSAGSSLEGTAASVLDAQGRVIMAFTLTGPQSIDVHSWAAGVYTLRLADGTVLKIIKQ